jgi:hypothetical protein
LTPVPPRTRFARIETLGRQLGVALITLLVISLVTFAATNYKSPEEVARQALAALEEIKSSRRYRIAERLARLRPGR